MRYKALVIGGGRIGAGFGWPEYPYCYIHAQAYAKSERCNLMGIVEPNQERAAWCEKRWGVPVYKSVSDGLAATKPDVVSVCVPPVEKLHKAIYDTVMPVVKGAWWEKPYLGHPMNGKPIQVNYYRRFDAANRMVAAFSKGRKSTLFVWAKDDIHTRCHFEDLARWWGSTLVYHDNTGELPQTNHYRVDFGKWAFEFRHGGAEGGFMESALDNLLDAIEGKATLLSPA